MVTVITPRLEADPLTTSAESGTCQPGAQRSAVLVHERRLLEPSKLARRAVLPAQVLGRLEQQAETLLAVLVCLAVLTPSGRVRAATCWSPTRWPSVNMSADT
ncbi:MAG: hypothetical protein ABI336_05925, partial [Humibacillus sp.]